MMLILLYLIYTLVHHWKELTHWDPRLIAAMPLFGAGFTALILPLGVQLVFLKEHAHLNPLIPAQYGRLLVTVWSAFFENGGKVTEKEL